MNKLKIYAPFLIVLIAVIGLFIRLYQIHTNQFLFYDEGMYLGYNRAFLNLVANNPPHDLNELGIICSLMFKTALTTPKALWFFILNLRVFVLGPEGWYFARIISALSGLGTIVVLYFWSKHYFKSQRIALLSALVLLVLPSHVFYSRLGMQEALSSFLFLSAIYLFMLRDRMNWMFFISAVLLACVYFTNYRMIIAPVYIVFIEFFKSVTSQKKFHWQKVGIYTAVFYSLVFLVGSLYGGSNLEVTFAWMFHQAQDAGGKFNPINFVSYPYYVFALEGFFFALFFWGNLYFLKLRNFSKMLPFGVVLLQMVVFSFAAEKGARYLCVVLPFMAAAGAVFFDDCLQRFTKWKTWTLTLGTLSLVLMIYISGSVAMARTDYGTAVNVITEHDPQAVIVSTQPLVEGLFLNDDKRMIPCPNDLASLVGAYKQGAKYLIIDPQAYISWTNNGRRFSPPLFGFLQAVLTGVQPIAVFPHLNDVLLKRFVLDHNEQILDSIQFLSAAPREHYGLIRIYDLGNVLSFLKNQMTGN